MLNFLKWLLGSNRDEFEDDEGSEFLTFIVDSDYRNEPCKGSLNVGTRCKGCSYEKEHTNK